MPLMTHSQFTCVLICNTRKASAQIFFYKTRKNQHTQQYAIEKNSSAAAAAGLAQSRFDKHFVFSHNRAMPHLAGLIV